MTEKERNSKSNWPVPEKFLLLARRRKEKRGVAVTRTIADALLFALEHRDIWE